MIAHSGTRTTYLVLLDWHSNQLHRGTAVIVTVIGKLHTHTLPGIQKSPINKKKYDTF